MPITSGNWAELLTPQTTEAFVMGFTSNGRRESMIGSLFATPGSQRAFEEHLGAGQFSSDWEFEATGRVPYDDKNKGFLTRFTHREYAKGFIVTRKMVDDNLFPEIMGDARELGDAAFRHREKSAASVFANAFSAATTEATLDAFGFPVVGGDLVALGSAAHPQSAADTGSTQNNEGTLALSRDNVGTTRVAMMNFTDDRGDILNVMPDQLLVPPELEDTAATITRSLMDPTSANNAVNPQAGRFSTMVWHYLEDTNAWFMMDSARRQRDLIWYERIPLEFGREEDFDTFETKFRAYMRYSRRWRDWRWVYAQNPS